ncbi:SAM-dependent methyltransferase [Enterococcus sp. 10A9_DIV0425]|uniref:SAM-dependent methyltransferase n=1 Tax=Candidatus Enterococcus wittei TaxID=1987383 RepID=A0A2C9XQ94_9ENTE|nr:class I SAM-dependent rRNA methyltransferase [Enterococcus sp. 10A9_DIV0425]OTP12365.1 SAM-dependent methyltransferase [Enterococcus sp. 10A9_DIV0425]THE12260.1 class I SAM-dependent rRNA methyltransferase [Enterococcus hirae]
MKINIKKRASTKFKKGYPLIQQEDLVQAKIITTDWVELVDPQGNFLGKGYLGKQNKGIGWILSQQDEPFDQAFFERKFFGAKEQRTIYFSDEQTTAFRLFNGEGDGIGGLTIDYYDRFAVFSWYNETLYKHRRLLIAAFQVVYPEVLGIYEKIRFETTRLPESQHVTGEVAVEPLLIKENGVTYATYLNEGLMTGIFLDQKEVRGALIDGLALGKSVLNMFSYTGAFSVAAAMGGASTTTSVDLAKRSLKKTREQFEVNGLSTEDQRIIVMDVFEYFKYAQRKNLSYDVIVLDPPSFARNKKKVFRVAKNYGELVKDSLAILSDDGILVASTNAANVSVDQFQAMIEDELLATGVDYQIIGVYRLPNDFQTIASFPEGNYLKVFIYQIKK